MRNQPPLFPGFSTALGSFFGIVFLWALIEAAAHRHIQPASARGAVYAIIAAVSVALGIAAARRARAAHRVQPVTAPAQKPGASTPAAPPNKAPGPPPQAARQAAENIRAAIAALQQAHPSMAGPAAPQQASGTTRPAAAAAPPADTVTETVTVILRRQIPPRFAEPPRSWLGGLPMLPDDVEWPRSVSSEYPQRGERPLHFVAQIACADLPPDLWGGLGPRQGWLLLFIDPNQGVPEESDAFRILHTGTLGSERTPPADLGPVHDGVYIAWDFGHCGGEAFVPRIWRRWPVDLVTMPNEASIEGRKVRVAPPDLAQRLYPGAQVDDAAARLPHPTPFTRRGALYALNTALHGFAKSAAPRKLPEKLLAHLQAPNGIDQIRACVEGQRDKMRALLAERQAAEPPVPAAQLAALEKDIATRADMLAFLAAHATPQALIAYFQDAQIRLSEWRAASRSRLEQLRTTLLEGDPDATFTEAEWTALRAHAATEPYRGYTYHIWGNTAKNPDDPKPPIGLVPADQTLTLEPGRGSLELVADYYVDPARQALIPPHLLADFEASWRRLRSNRPHRMGGYQDGVQSDARIGPTAHLLLFQIASDDAMHWCWGDVGAYYIYIRPADLRRGDFAQSSIVLECH